MNGIDLSIVIACYNEESLLLDSVDELVRVLQSTATRFELVFVDDASRDRTVPLIRECLERHPTVPAQVLLHQENAGRGRAVSDGFRAATGRIIGYLDIDLEVHARYIPSMIDAIDRQGYDVATAWRFYQVSRSGLVRAASSMIYLTLVHAVLGLPYRDTETGFKFFRRDALDRVLPRVQHAGWFWDTEIMAYCALEGLRVAEIPCVFMRRTDKVSSVRLVRDSIEYVRNLLRFRPVYASARRERSATTRDVAKREESRTP